MLVPLLPVAAASIHNFSILPAFVGFAACLTDSHAVMYACYVTYAQYSYSLVLTLVAFLLFIGYILHCNCN